METWIVQANSGIYLVEDSCLDACKRFQRQESSGIKGEWTTYEMEMSVWPDFKYNDWFSNPTFYMNDPFYSKINLTEIALSFYYWFVFKPFIAKLKP